MRHEFEVIHSKKIRIKPHDLARIKNIYEKATKLIFSMFIVLKMRIENG